MIVNEGAETDTGVTLDDQNTEGDGNNVAVDGDAAKTETDQPGAADKAPTAEELEQKDLAAFDKGLEHLAEKTGAKVDVAADPGAGKADAKPAAKGETKPEVKPGEAKPAAKAPDAEVEKEINALQLKGRSAERFREMSSEIKETRPIVENLKSLGIDRPEALNYVMKEAARGLEFEKHIHDANANPEQTKSAMLIIKAMNTGDPKQQRMAADAMFNEVKAVYAHLGVDLPGIVDPLEKHADLKKMVEEMDITREAAIEVAQARALKANTEARDANNAKLNQDRAANERLAATEKARIDELSDTLKGSDPQFEAKVADMAARGVWDRIGRLPVKDQYNEILREYRATKVAAAAPAPAPRVRPTRIVDHGANAAVAEAKPKFKSDLEAFEFGLQTVR